MNNKKTTNQPNMILVWFKALRPQAAFASICPVVVGLMIAHRHLGFVGTQGNMVAFLTLACAFALQTLSNLVNDYYDFKRGTDKQDRVGFERAMTTGLISEEEMRTACFITLGVAVFLGALLCWLGGWLILAVGVTALLFAWLYTATD